MRNGLCAAIKTATPAKPAWPLGGIASDAAVGDLEYADEVTLGRALSGRREM
jgi:hypothetical protein